MARVDREVVRQRLERELFEIENIEAKLPHTLEGYVAPEFEPTRYELEHRLYIAIQALLDTASHIAVALGARNLDTYRAATDALASLGVISIDLAERLEGAAGMRNAIAHTYLELDLAKVYAAMRSTDDLREFAASVWEWLELQ